jgi:signal transduction histidine kinase
MKAVNEVIQKTQSPKQNHQLAEFLDRNGAILKVIEEGIIIFNIDGRIATANPSAARLLEQPIYKITKSDIEALIGCGGSLNGHDQVFELCRGDKKLLVEISPIHDACGKTLCHVAVFHDLVRATDIDRARNDFVSLASHELRTPLSAVLGYIDMLREDVYGPLTDQQRSAIERAAANTEQLVSLINNLLDQAQIQSGGLSLHNRPFAPIKLVENVKIIMSRGARNKGLELTVHISDDMPIMLCGDYQRLCQILTNLVDNAIKFTEIGTVHINIYCPDENHWAMQVTDTGRGIPKDAQTDIFVPFRQVDGPMEREYRGAGLGLTIVQQLIERMEGKIDLESQVGRGSTFTVTLPLVPRSVDGLCPETSPTKQARH